MPPPFPGKEQILEFINDSPGKVGKREIARAFHLTPGQRIRLKQALRELEDEGALGRKQNRRYFAGKLPTVAVLEVSGTDLDGEVMARPLNWEGEGEPPLIYMAPEKRGHPALGIGDKALARLSRSGGAYEAQVIRRISSAPSMVLGVYAVDGKQGRIRSTDRRARNDLMVAAEDAKGAVRGDLVRAEVLPGRRSGLQRARVVERIAAAGPKAVSLIALHDHGIPTEFTAAAVKQANAAGPTALGKREDLRNLPLVTIDGSDARDFDDAVWAEPDSAPANPGGWRLVVAIADVSWYVRPGDALDKCAYERGNSAYFPDRVVPMLPEALSNGWCSLVPGEDRPCLACHMTIDAGGNLRSSRFARGLMKSAARLTYEQVQQARDGVPDQVTAELLETVITPLYGAYGRLLKAREERGVLELDLPERRVIIGDDGQVIDIKLRPRFDSHKLIEEFMIAANVAAALTLTKGRLPCMYRVHDEPSPEKVEDLRQFLSTIGINLAKAQVIKPMVFNRILQKAAVAGSVTMVSEVVLRAQARAEYSPTNIGHFGLALKNYCHFTSPIRRYSDLLVHRALISELNLGEGGLQDPGDFAAIGAHLGDTERRAAAAERDSVDRFTAGFLAERIGARFSGRINGVTRFGLFVTLDDTGADGLVPVRSLPGGRYQHDEARHMLREVRGKRQFHIGEAIEVTLVEANPVTGGMIMHPVESNGYAGPNKKEKRGAAPSKGRRR
ncbi:MAG: ribonuclease R [Rhodospirillales bacterium RIFCSPLOWO2_12_FULL_58_28]|nr:MAG: ribonuclease R [Rhodospirillales bacterium RIFCSPLOWO2_02_FULL_58_16]OHC77444.1 MAG: ribonuclease R [Rhodospirillales bacterium RIFCSPLOWO2_12_FULL_58_28]